MDKGSIIGFILAAILILGSMALGGSILMYVDVQSVLIVFGGTVATTLAKERMEVVMGAFAVAKNAIFDQGHDLDVVITRIVELSKKARESGVLALESEEVPTDFMKKGLRLVTDGVSSEEIEEALEMERISLLRRHKRGRDVFKFMTGIAPSMGMIGTLIGLVAMLQTLDNPAAIGPAMAVALLTTLYGALVAFVICQPIAEKLASRTDEEAVSMEVALRGFAAIARGDRPVLIQEKLEAFLLPKVRAAKKAAEG